MTIAAILSQFPRYDEAFILRELTALARGPWELVIVSLRPCRDRVIHADARPLQPKTLYAPFVWSASLWASHAHFLRRNPAGYWSALWWIVSRHWRHPIALLKSLAFFPKAVHFARQLQQRGVRHAHAFWATYPTVVAIVIEQLTGIPYSLSGHAHDIYTVNPALAEKIIGARFVLTCTEHNREHLTGLANGRTSRVVLSYHGVDLSRFSAPPKSPSTICRLLCVGSLLPCKGLETLIEGCARLRGLGVPFHCTLAGGGPLEPSLRRLIARHGLESSVTMTGYVSQDDVARLYAQADVFVLPLVSRIHWGIPNVVIEALATKTPVVCCALPSLKELVAHGESGWIIPEADPDALAQTLRELWSDPALRARLADAGYSRVVERFALERTGEQLRQMFAEALA